MQSFDKIFQHKLAQLHPDSRTPVTCSLLDTFHTQKSLLAAAQARKESTERKNLKIAEENLRYREQLEQKMALLQQKHSKNRKEALTKVVKSEEQRGNYRRDIFSRHKEAEKKAVREKLGLFREHSQRMQQYWSDKKLKTQRSFRSQSAVKPVYMDSVERKRGLEHQESQRGTQVKVDLLERHEGREDKVHRLLERRHEELHEPHKEHIDRVLQKNEEILDAKITSLIHSIGEDFRKSGDVLKGKARAQAKRLKDQRIDEEDHRLTVRSNFIDRTKQRSSSLSQCACKRINNIEESGLSPALKQSARHLHLGDTLRRLEREPSETLARNSQFLTRSHSFRSTASYKQNMLSQRKQVRDEDRLRRQREIAESLALRKAMEVEGNCYVRKTRVK